MPDYQQTPRNVGQTNDNVTLAEKKFTKIQKKKTWMVLQKQLSHNSDKIEHKLEKKAAKG